MDSHCYDQYSVIYEGGDRTAIMKNAHNEPMVIEERAVSFQIKGHQKFYVLALLGRFVELFCVEERLLVEFITQSLLKKY